MGFSVYPEPVISFPEPEPQKVYITKILTYSDYWLAPADVTRVDVEMCGGGGGGSRGNIVQGGGYGSYDFFSIDVIPGNPYYITIGAGGNGATSNGNGGNGGVSYFGGIYVVPGGSGGRTFNNGQGTPGAKGGFAHPIVSTAQNYLVPVQNHGAVLGGAGGTGAQNGYSTGASLGGPGGGNGGWDTALNATAGKANTGGGGGGGGAQTNGANGGSGVCIIRYWSAL